MRYLVTLGEYSIVGIVEVGIDQPLILEANLTDMLEKVVYEYENSLIDANESIMSRFRDCIEGIYSFVNDINDEWFDELIHLPYPTMNQQLKNMLNNKFNERE